MVITLIFSGITACTSLFGLYIDQETRKQFEDDFMATKKIGDNKLLNGIITTSIPYNNCVAYRLDKFYKKINRYYIYKPKNKSNKYITYNFPKVHTIEYWDTNNIMLYRSPLIKFDGLNLLINDKTKISYTEKKLTYISPKEMLIKKYIPNNSTISVFGKKINDTSYSAIYMGKEKDVLENVAYDYYGISDTKTILLILIFGISGFIITRNCVARLAALR